MHYGTSCIVYTAIAVNDSFVLVHSVVIIHFIHHNDGLTLSYHLLINYYATVVGNVPLVENGDWHIVGFSVFVRFFFYCSL